MVREFDHTKESNQETEDSELQEQIEEPSRELAEKILSECSFEDRFMGYRLRERAGSVPVVCYSFEEVVNLLRDKLPMIDLPGLARWVREVMTDEALADKMAAAKNKGQNDYERILLVRDLAEERLSQCKTVMARMKQRG